MSGRLRGWKRKLPFVRADKSTEKELSLPEAKLPASTTSVYDSVPLPLGDTMCIRIIRIWPSHRADFSDDIVCTFEILDVVKKVILTDNIAAKHRHADEDLNIAGSNESLLPPDKQHYRALSYTWGDSSAERTIILNGQRFNVRTNLWDFLDRARRNALFDYLWIDALCINQTIVQERNHQVAMMGDVYSNAENVIVWLGASTPEAVFPIEKFYAAILWHGLSEAWGIAAYSDVRYLFDGPYWSRVWIVQEFVLANSIDIWLGRLQMRSEFLEEIFRPSFDTFISRYLRSTNATKIFLWRRSARCSKKNDLVRRHETFRRLLIAFDGCMKCAEPMDVVYALLPLLSATELYELDITPDYSASATELYVKILDRFQCCEIDDANEVLTALRNLTFMLGANLEDRRTQLAWMALRRAWYGKSSIEISPLFGPDHHHCYKSSVPETLRVVDIDGCSHCSLVPRVTAGLSKDVKNDFSEIQWRQWARTLSRGDEESDRLLGHHIEYDLDMFSGQCLVRT